MAAHCLKIREYRTVVEPELPITPISNGLTCSLDKNVSTCVESAVERKRSGHVSFSLDINAGRNIDSLNIFIDVAFMAPISFSIFRTAVKSSTKCYIYVLLIG